MTDVFDTRSSGRWSHAAEVNRAGSHDAGLERERPGRQIRCRAGYSTAAQRRSTCHGHGRLRLSEAARCPCLFNRVLWPGLMSSKPQPGTAWSIQFAAVTMK